MKATQPALRCCSEALSNLQPGDHLCGLDETEKEHRAWLTHFWRQGLERGEKVLSQPLVGCGCKAEPGESREGKIRWINYV